jgi:hypothetical protein
VQEELEVGEDLEVEGLEVEELEVEELEGELEVEEGSGVDEKLGVEDELVLLRRWGPRILLEVGC